MNCPPEIAGPILEIIQMGLLTIRQQGWAGDAARCAVEADHIHNLPDLLRDYSPDRLWYYWEAEKAAYETQGTAVARAYFDPLWARLAPHVPHRTDPIAAREGRRE
jgi:hypothetical protein